MLYFNAVGQLQTVVVCPSCSRTGKDAGFKDCCFRFALMLLGIQDERKHSLRRDRAYWADTQAAWENASAVRWADTQAAWESASIRKFYRDSGGYCYAYEECNEEECKGYKPYDKRFTNGCNSECQHHGLDGRCTA